MPFKLNFICKKISLYKDKHTCITYWNKAGLRDNFGDKTLNYFGTHRLGCISSNFGGGHGFRMQIKNEVYLTTYLLNNMDVVQNIRIQWLHWIRHVFRMDGNILMKWIFHKEKSQQSWCMLINWIRGSTLIVWCNQLEEMRPKQRFDLDLEQVFYY